LLEVKKEMLDLLKRERATGSVCQSGRGRARAVRRMMTPKQILAVTEDFLIALQVAIRGEAKRIADYEQILRQLGPGDPRRSQAEDWIKQEQERLKQSQALLAELVQVRTAATEALEKGEG
jgi:hypothetical protein